MRADAGGYFVGFAARDAVGDEGIEQVSGDASEVLLGKGVLFEGQCQGQRASSFGAAGGDGEEGPLHGVQAVDGGVLKQWRQYWIGHHACEQ